MPISNMGEAVISAEVFAEPRDTAINTDVFSVGVDQFRTQADTVKVDILGVGAAAATLDPAGGEGFNKNRTVTEAFKNITLDTPQIVGFSLTPTEYRNLTPEGFRQRVEREANKLNNYANTLIYSTILAANYAKSIVVGGSGAFDASVIGDINANADYLKLDRSMRPSMVLQPAHYENLLSQPSLVNVSDRGARDVNLGGVPYVDYRDNRMYKSSLLGGNLENLVGFVTDKGGICVGFGLEDDLGQEMQEGYFSDIMMTSNGIPIRYTHTVDTNSKLHNFTWTLTMGVEVAQEDKLIRFTSS